MVEGMERMGREEFRGARPRVFVTNADNPDLGRTFVWTQVGWFEREEGSWGDVAFTPIADDEDQLRGLLEQEDPDTDLVEVDIKTEYGRIVFDEFSEEAEQPLYPESPENSSEEPFEEQDTE
jgi:hypothetical protein